MYSGLLSCPEARFVLVLPDFWLFSLSSLCPEMFFESWRRGCGIHVPWTGSYNRSALDMKILEMVVALRGDSGGTRREEDSKTGNQRGEWSTGGLIPLGASGRLF